MRWPDSFPILWNLLRGQLGGWIISAAGILIAVILHRKDIKCRIWPAIPAAFLWLACEFSGTNVQSYGTEALAFLVGNFSVGYAAGWLVMDLISFVKNKKKEQM